MTTMAPNFQDHGIKTPDDLFNFCQHLDYGWVDRAGKKHHGVNNSPEYFLQSPAELLESKIGICWDQTELQRAFFESLGVPVATYFLYYYLSDDNCPSHSILVFKDGADFCWFEPMFFSTPFYYSGVHKYSSERELLDVFKTRFARNGRLSGVLPEDFDKSALALYKYPRPPYGLSAPAFYDHCRAGENSPKSKTTLQISGRARCTASTPTSPSADTARSRSTKSYS